MFTPCHFFSEEFTKILTVYLQRYQNVRTQSEKWNLVRLFCEFCHKDFLEIDGSDVSLYFNDMERRIANGTLSASTYQSRKSILVTLSNYIVEEYPDLCFENHFVHTSIYNVSGSIRPSHIVSMSEVDAFLEASKDWPMMYTIISLVLRVSLTASEIVSLRECNVQQVDGRLVIHFPRVGQRKERVIPLPPDVEQVLANYLCSSNYLDHVDEQRHLFYNTKGRPLSQRILDSSVKKVMKKAGLDAGYTLRDIRSRSILDMINGVGASCGDAARRRELLDGIGEFAGIRELRLSTYVGAAHLVHECPASLSNLQVKSFPFDNPIVEGTDGGARASSYK